MFLNEELIDYFKSRLPFKRFIPLAFFLVVAGYSISDVILIKNIVISVTMAFLLVLFYRLMDDIEDRSRDIENFPHRVLCKTNNIQLFKIFSVFLFIINSCVIFIYFDSIQKLILYFLLTLFLYTWYKIRLYINYQQILNSHIVLFKYPLIVYLLSQNLNGLDPLMVLLCLLSVYLVFLIFEMLDDTEILHLSYNKYLLLAYLISLLSIWVVITLKTYPHENYLFWFIWGFILIVNLFLVVSTYLNLKRENILKGNIKYFIIALFAYLTITTESQL